MAVTKLVPPVQARGIDMQDAEDMAASLATLAKGEFVGTGETFPERSQANATAAKFVRVIESRYDVKLRSRTWQQDGAGWTFGIRQKDEGEADENPAEEEKPKK
jgi:hypothetical protein